MDPHVPDNHPHAAGLRRGSCRDAARFAACGSGLWVLAVAPAVQGASSASFQINNAVLDAAGGVSTSPSHVVAACVGSEIAGSSSSANFKLETGCGPTALALAKDFVVPAVDTSAAPIPTLSDVSLALLAIMVAFVAMKRLRALRR